MAASACGHASDPPAPAPAVPAAAPSEDVDCQRVDFAASTPVPEASGAAWMTIDGKLVLVVIGDSGNDGAYGLVDPETGATTEQGKLPLGGPGDDLEGVAVRGGKLYGLTSSGFMRVWERRGTGFALVAGPYAIGDGDMICDARGVNCGRNYEGLCMTETRAYAASKADGVLYPLAGEPLRVSREGAIKVTRGNALGDCAFDDQGRLWAGNNILGFALVSRIDGDKVVTLGALGVGNPEVIAVRGEAMYRMSDLNNAPSLMAKFRCAPKQR